MKNFCAVFVLVLGLVSGRAFADVQNIGSAKEFDDLVNSGKPVLVDFFATWCGPCKRLAPILDGLAEQYGAQVTFARVDVDQVGELASRFQIESIPDVRLFKGGKQQDQFMGLQDKSEYEKALKKVTN